MASGLLGASSVTTGGSCWRREKSAKNYYARFDATALWKKTGKIQREYNVIMSSQHNLKYNHRGIEKGSTCRASERKYAVNAASEQSSKYEPKAQYPESIWNSAKRVWDIFTRFNRPYAAIGLAIGAASGSLLAVDKLSDLSPKFFIGWLPALVTAICANTVNCGLNELCDIEIDKINKPYLPLASGEMSFKTAVTIVISSFVVSSWLALTIHSWPLFWTCIASTVLAVVYNVDLPMLRWKKSTPLAATSISLNAGVTLPLGYFFHMQTVVFKRPATFPRQLIFSIAMTTLFFIVIVLFKDIHDVEGDQKFGVQSLAAHLGGERVFRICVSILEMAYGTTILVGTTSPFFWSKIVMAIGHAILASILWHHAKFVDIKSKVAVQSFYMFIWKLLWAEYFLMPLFR